MHSSFLGNPVIKVAFDVVDAVVPYATDGKLRVSKLEILEWVRGEK